VLYVLADDPNTHGVLVARPVPDEVLWALEPKQDIDGATPASPYKPALMTGMFRLVDRAAPDLAERQVVVAGAAGKVGSQIMNVLMERGITATPIDSKLGHNDDDLREAVAKAGALFTAMRQPGKLTEEWLPDGIVLFDATVEPVKVDGKTQMWGDVHRSVYDSARDITLNRVPGVIGPLATCALYDNAIEAAHVRLGA
jgi:5,10-methylene-tetrahydrofolate dehydrogenase/methenyl tetrahydrofolate cyclohydrolase